MGNGLLKYAFFIEQQNHPELFLEITYKNSKNEAVASRILIR